MGLGILRKRKEHFFYEVTKAQSACPWYREILPVGTVVKFCEHPTFAQLTGIQHRDCVAHQYKITRWDHTEFSVCKVGDEHQIHQYYFEMSWWDNWMRNDANAQRSPAFIVVENPAGMTELPDPTEPPPKYKTKPRPTLKDWLHYHDIRDQTKHRAVPRLPILQRYHGKQVLAYGTTLDVDNFPQVWNLLVTLHPSMTMDEVQQCFREKQIPLGNIKSGRKISIFKWLNRVGFDEARIQAFQSKLDLCLRDKPLILSCSYKDLIRCSDTEHFTSCYSQDGCNGSNVWEMLTRPDVCIIGHKDKAGDYTFRYLAFWVEGKLLLNPVPYPKPGCIRPTLYLAQGVGDDLPIWRTDVKAYDKQPGDLETIRPEPFAQLYNDFRIKSNDYRCMRRILHKQ